MNKHDNSLTFALAGNPNVGKSTVFNAITKLKQHTGNWAGKTVNVCTGEFKHNGTIHKITDLPGSYSIFADSEEERVSKEYLESCEYDAVIIVVDANALERNLNYCIQILSITSQAILCLNMSDSANKNGINIDTDELSLRLGIPVISTEAKTRKGIDSLIKAAVDVAERQIKTYSVQSILDINNISDNFKISQYVSDLSNEICKASLTKIAEENCNSAFAPDKYFISKKYGIPVMIVMLIILFWLTATGANFISDGLSYIFSYIICFIENALESIKVPDAAKSLLCDGILKTISWVVAVMLPPSLIFFPIFTLLEDWGYLPRVAFNLDGLFCKSGVSGKQSLTMMMGVGCNACGVTGCRIMNSKVERNAGIITNSFIPCNGRLPMLIVLCTIFFTAEITNSVIISLLTACTLIVLLLISFSMTLVVTKIIAMLSKNKQTLYTLELPGYKKPEFFKTIILAVKNKVINILLRAISVALPAGALIWIFANISVGNKSILLWICQALDPIGKLMGMDGEILCGFILGFPANEIVIPIILMCYCGTETFSEFTSNAQLLEILKNNGWTITTVICTMLFCVFHFPCATTCITVFKETKSKTVTILAFTIPLLIGIILCTSVKFTFTVLGIS